MTRKIYLIIFILTICIVISTALLFPVIQRIYYCWGIPQCHFYNYGSWEFIPVMGGFLLLYAIPFGIKLKKLPKSQVKISEVWILGTFIFFAFLYLYFVRSIFSNYALVRNGYLKMQYLNVTNHQEVYDIPISIIKAYRFNWYHHVSKSSFLNPCGRNIFVILPDNTEIKFLFSDSLLDYLLSLKPVPIIETSSPTAGQCRIAAYVPKYLPYTMKYDR